MKSNFKEIKATFDVVVSNGGKLTLQVSRKPSGCNPYGDKSATYINNVNGLDNSKEYLDTRYDMIPTDNEKWVNFWLEYLKDIYKDATYNNDISTEIVEIDTKW